MINWVAHVTQTYNPKNIENVLRGANVIDPVDQIHAVVCNPTLFFDNSTDDEALFGAWWFVNRKLNDIARACIDPTKFHRESEIAGRAISNCLFYKNKNLRDLMYGLRDKDYLNSIVSFCKSTQRNVQSYFLEYEKKVHDMLEKECV